MSLNVFLFLFYRMTDAAMKCALICCECLTHMENYPEAAAIFIKMTTEDCDLKSALMLEQAAHSFLNVNYIRKYALHCVLAGMLNSSCYFIGIESKSF